MYFDRALDKYGNTSDFYLSPKRNVQATKHFLGKALSKKTCPYAINTDKAPAYGAAFVALKKEGKCPETVIQRQIKYLNN